MNETVTIGVKSIDSFKDMAFKIISGEHKNEKIKVWFESLEAVVSAFTKRTIKVLQSMKYKYYMNMIDIMKNTDIDNQEELMIIFYQLDSINIIDLMIHNTGIYVKLNYRRINIDFNIMDIN